MSKPSKAKCIGILTSGGDCPGLNAAIRGVAKAARGAYGIGVIGILDGFTGLVENRVIHIDERELVWVRAMIQSMTPRERRRPEIINGSRRKRIARGSGTSVQQVNRLLKQFNDMKKMMKSLTRMKKKGRTPEMFRGGIQ